MTQEVQPLTWQKRTNLEEHQQFFSKINEIIANLAPTVDEAEQAIAQATQAVASANAAVATANAASANADAAAQQAQTAAGTVAGYDARLTTAEGDIGAAEGDIAALQGRMGTAEGNITALQNVQADYVKKAGAAQTVTSQIMVPTTTTGVRDTQIANGTRIQNDLAAYEPMVRTSGHQSIAGIKEFLVRIDSKAGFKSDNATSEGATIMRITDRTNSDIQEGAVALSRNVANGVESSRQYMHTIYNGNDYARLSLELLPTGTARIVLYKNIDGTLSATTVVTL